MEAKPKRRRQCRQCPWKVGSNPRDIPGEYCETKHKGLANTIADPGRMSAGPLRAMACHETPPGKELVCVGWAVNQLGPGNNIALRIRAMTDPSLHDLETVGPQHERFEDTLPTPARRLPGRDVRSFAASRKRRTSREG